MKKLLSVLLCAVIMMSALFPVKASAADYGLAIENSAIVLTPEQLADDPAVVVEEALKLAKENASAEYPITVYVPSGTYYMSKCLHIYSNTNLILQPDTFFIRKKEENYNLLKAGLQDEVNTGYTGYMNINISGGVWDCAYKGTSCGMRFAHCMNVTLQNVTILNNYNSHHMELAAANNFKILNCRFSGYKRTNTADGQAIQIDILHNSTHFPSYEKFDDTPCMNVTVDSCSFENVYAGVGTRSGVIGSYFDNIRITNNSFVNVKDTAISAFNYRNSVIENNYISSSTIGVFFENFPVTNLAGKFYMPNSKSAATDIINYSNCSISNNTIGINNNTGRDISSGIAVCGGVLTENEASYGLQLGSYHIDNITVSNNTIKTNRNSYGIILRYVNSSSITGNNVKANSRETNGCSAIDLEHSSNNTVASNRLDSYYNGISVTKSSLKNKFTYNAILNSFKYAYSADQTAGGTVYNTNRYKNNSAKFLVGEKTYKDKKVTGLKVVKNKKKKTNTLTWKRNSAAKGYLIYRATKENGTYKLIKTITNNKTTKFVNKKINTKKHYYYKIIAYKKIKRTKIYSKESKVVHT